ncbi:hypothetical protein GGS20DRAFT_573306 [Poronia punctata]|nr:hypothetical protein GGS20DRAFT_573306 [Poronia punctata]
MPMYRLTQHYNNVLIPSIIYIYLYCDVISMHASYALCYRVAIELKRASLTFVFIYIAIIFALFFKPRYLAIYYILNILSYTF